MDEGEEADVESIEAGCEAAEVFEFVEASFDPIAEFIEVAVVWDEDFAGATGRMTARIPAPAMSWRKALLS